MFENIRKERLIRKALRAIARQRVALILKPGNVMVVENSTPDTDWFNLAVKTAHIRGWERYCMIPYRWGACGLKETILFFLMK